jgi:predicted regulator of Ras-like GTPase activity (Roadblock/LC7/MglB family)
MALVNRLPQDQLSHHHHQLMRAIGEAINSEIGGEVVVKWGQERGRIFITKNRVAWVSASTAERTFLGSVVHETDVSIEELREVYDECKRNGRNFGETIMEWGLIEPEKLRQLLLDHTAFCLLEILAWPEVQTVFIPTTRRYYQGSLLLDAEHVLRRALELDGEGRVQEETHQALLERSSTIAAPPQELTLVPTDPNLSIDEGAWDDDFDEESAVKPMREPTPAEERAERALTVLQEFAEIRGYWGAAVFSEEGQLCARNSMGHLDFQQLNSSIHDLTQAALSITDRLRREPAQTIEIGGKDIIILVRRLDQSTEEETDTLQTILAVFRRPCNLALGKIRIHSAARALSRLTN